MAITVTLYNQASRKLSLGEYNLAALKLMLLNGATFTAADTNITSVSANEVSGFGWPVGGQLLTNVTVTTVTTNDAKLNADNISATATGGAIGPADGAALYDSTDGSLVAYIDFGGAQAAPDGTPFNVNWHIDGIIEFAV